MNPPSEIHVRLFAQARELCGAPAVRIPAAEAPDAARLRAALIRCYPVLESLVPRSAVAVNLEYVDDARAIRSGDDVALIPPVAGG